MGIYEAKRKIPIAITGLAAAGKTTFIERLRTGKFNPEKLATLGLDVEQIEYDESIHQIFDLGGQKAFRTMVWENYVKLSLAVCFILDSANRETMKESMEWFWKVISWIKGDAIILLLSNKIDLEESMNIEEIVKEFDLAKMSSYPTISFHFFPVSVKTGEGIQEAILWLNDKIKSVFYRLRFPVHHIRVYSVEKGIILDFPISIHEDSDSHDNCIFVSRMIEGLVSDQSAFYETNLHSFSFGTIKSVLIRREKHLIVLIAATSANPSLLRAYGESIVREFNFEIEDLPSRNEIIGFLNSKFLTNLQ